jgi:hypothetical protein
MKCGEIEVEACETQNAHCPLNDWYGDKEVCMGTTEWRKINVPRWKVPWWCPLRRRAGIYKALLKMWRKVTGK